MIRPATYFIHPDEACYYMEEKNLQTGYGFHRIQRLTVVRDDQLADYITDLGPAEKFRAPEVQAPGGWRDPQTGRIHIWETVGRLMAIADEHRNRDLQNIGIPVSNLVEAYANKVMG